MNLAYVAGAEHGRNLELIRNVLGVCQKKKVSKFIHISTAVVNGRTRDSLITEESSALPYSEYDQTKLMVEKFILNSDLSFESVILRPTAVFGPEGKNLIQLANHLCFGSVFKNYLKSCLYGRRTMNLVSVENVVSAIRFLIFSESGFLKQVFIVEDDESLNNNYIGVEKMLMHSLGVKDYPVPRFVFPQFFLRFILRVMGKSNIDPNRRYSAVKLEACGWVKALDFDSKVESFAIWFKRKYDV